MANPLVDQITHPGNEDEFPLDLDAVVAAAVRYNVILELNDHSFDPHSSRVASTAREREFAAGGARGAARRSPSARTRTTRCTSAASTPRSPSPRSSASPRSGIVNRSADAVLDHLLAQARTAAARRRWRVGVADDPAEEGASW